MSIKVMTAVWECSRHKGSDLLLLLAIADHADDNGVAYPSVPRLAQKTRLKIRNVQYRLRVLQQSKELTILLKAGPRGTHLYRIHVDEMVGVQTLQGIEGVKTSTSSSWGANFAGGVQTLQGVSQCTLGVHPSAPEPSLEPSEKKDNSLTTFESFSGCETGVGFAPGQPAPPKAKSPRKKKTLATDDWLAIWLQKQSLLPIPFKFLNDEKWWEAASILVTDGFNETWLEREFAKMVLFFHKPGEHQPRTEAGWKRFLTHWLQVADKKEQREKRQEKLYGQARQ